jgi:adenosylcobyric acid synthase
VPYADGITIPEEDSVALERRKREEKTFSSHTVNIAVIRLPHMANYTDFAELEREDGITLRYLTQEEDLSEADVVFLPGTKNTLGDLAWLWKEGWAKEILAYAKRGGRIVGVCGGYQILGDEIRDPFGVEGKRRKGKGLGLLPVQTELAAEKKVEKVIARSRLNGSRATIEGYEIHMGRSRVRGTASPAFSIIERAGVKVTETDGAVVNERRVWGTYLHGIFTNTSFRRSWLQGIYRLKGLRRRPGDKEKRDPYDAWATHLCNHLDMGRIFSLVGEKKAKRLLWKESARG